MSIEEVQVCPECSEVIDDLEVFSLYECPDCGDTFSQEDTGSHRSECCGKFSAKVGETHEGCTGLNEDAETQYRNDETGEVFESEEEAKQEEAESDDEEADARFRFRKFNDTGRPVYYIPVFDDMTYGEYGRTWEGQPMYTHRLAIAYTYVRPYKFDPVDAERRKQAEGRKFVQMDTLSLSGPYSRPDPRTGETVHHWTWGSSRSTFDARATEHGGVIEGKRVEFTQTVRDFPIKLIEMDIDRFHKWQREMEQEVLDGKRKVFR